MIWLIHILMPIIFFALSMLMLHCLLKKLNDWIGEISGNEKIATLFDTNKDKDINWVRKNCVAPFKNQINWAVIPILAFNFACIIIISLVTYTHFDSLAQKGPKQLNVEVKPKFRESQNSRELVALIVSGTATLDQLKVCLKQELDFLTQNQKLEKQIEMKDKELELEEKVIELESKKQALQQKKADAEQKRQLNLIDAKTKNFCDKIQAINNSQLDKNDKTRLITVLMQMAKNQGQQNLFFIEIKNYSNQRLQIEINGPTAEIIELSPKKNTTVGLTAGRYLVTAWKTPVERGEFFCFIAQVPDEQNIWHFR